VLWTVRPRRHEHCDLPVDEVDRRVLEDLLGPPVGTRPMTHCSSGSAVNFTFTSMALSTIAS
jgi:hypothetical protein